MYNRGHLAAISLYAKPRELPPAQLVHSRRTFPPPRTYLYNLIALNRMYNRGHLAAFPAMPNRANCLQRSWCIRGVHFPPPRTYLYNLIALNRMYKRGHIAALFLYAKLRELPPAQLAKLASSFICARSSSRLSKRLSSRIKSMKSTCTVSPYKSPSKPKI
jgi:hypothetical protein